MESTWNTTVYYKYEGTTQQEVCVKKENPMMSELEECNLQSNLINHEYAHSSSNICVLKEEFFKTELKSVDEIEKIEIKEELVESNDHLQNIVQLKEEFLKTELKSGEEIGKIEIKEEPLKSSDHLQNIFQLKEGFLKTELKSAEEIEKIEIKEEPLKSNDYLQNITNKFITDADNHENRDNKATDVIDESAKRKYLTKLDSILEHGIVIINYINDLNTVSDVSTSGTAACNLGLTQTSEIIETKSDNKHFHEYKDLNRKLKMGGNKNKDKIYPCTICNKHFNFKSNLNTHMKTHPGKRTYKCDVCQKCFKQNGSLNVHMRTHTGVKPYKCDVCQKCFNQSGSLNVHMRTHTGEKPYKCEECQKCFKQSFHLNIHNMRTHTGVKPYYKC